MQSILTMCVPRLSYRAGRKHYVTWGSKSPQIFDHLEDRNLELYEEILKEARSRFELGKRIPRVGH
jgi:hypothetical protein